MNRLAGWYRDPNNRRLHSYWDGEKWRDQVEEPAQVVEEPPQVVVVGELTDPTGDADVEPDEDVPDPAADLVDRP
jgi:hypothetical protein